MGRATGSGTRSRPSSDPLPPSRAGPYQAPPLAPTPPETRNARATEHQGWRPGENLYLFIPPLGHRRRLTSPRLDHLQPGDFGIYNYANGHAHGFVYLGVDATGRALTADFGQPGGKVYECEVTDRGWGPLLLRGRPLDFAITLDSFEFTETAEAVSEWLERYGLPLEPWHPLEHFGEV